MIAIDGVIIIVITGVITIGVISLTELFIEIAIGFGQRDQMGWLYVEKRRRVYGWRGGRGQLVPVVAAHALPAHRRQLSPFWQKHD